jgi:hypothetical protein
LESSPAGYQPIQDANMARTGKTRALEIRRLPLPRLLLSNQLED